MSLGQKKTYTGMVRKETYAKGSKQEHQAVVLDTGDGTPMKLRIRGNNPFTDPELDQFVGMRVTLEGIAGSGQNILFVESASDIVVLGPPGRPARPPQGPRP